ncbi:hypothetical protein F3K20_30975 [Streptomyces scabiei]|nr:hypothetical protein [Streptomyces sp. LBUM 1477]MBP5886348.1 hypothetical protein [Streptomyces sp. LBUM 1487]QTU48645.1 hypothetical protein F3K20_30975 [Streptomyces sp. LBUM 1482]QTU64729.1 hypothetical protein F3K22_30340 [Streptomyces sp. LBUM 1475]
MPFMPGVRTCVRSVVVAGSAVVFAAAMALGAAGPARASATGSTAVGTFDYDVRGVGVRVPVGCFLTHTMDGSGRRITGQSAGVDCAGLAATFSRFCNWRIDFAYADTDNRTYRTSRGATHAECRGNPLRRAVPQRLPKFGKACAKFHVNGKLRAVQCHYITR